MSFQSQHGVIREPSLVECVFTVSHTYCFLTQWIQCCYAWGFLEQFNHREPWDETLNFYRSSRSTITNKDEMINTRDAEHVESWKCCQTVDVSHPSSAFITLFYLLSRTGAIFRSLPLSSSVLHCSSALRVTQSFLGTFVFPNRAFTQYKLTWSGSICPIVHLFLYPLFTVSINRTQRILVTLILVL